MSTIVDPYRDQARRGMVEAIAAGKGFFSIEPRDELDGRSLTEAWTAGDHEAVERWLDARFAETDRLAAQDRAGRAKRPA